MGRNQLRQRQRPAWHPAERSRMRSISAVSSESIRERIRSPELVAVVAFLRRRAFRVSGLTVILMATISCGCESLLGPLPGLGERVARWNPSSSSSVIPKDSATRATPCAIGRRCAQSRSSTSDSASSRERSMTSSAVRGGRSLRTTRLSAAACAIALVAQLGQHVHDWPQLRQTSLSSPPSVMRLEGLGDHAARASQPCESRGRGGGP